MAAPRAVPATILSGATATDGLNLGENTLVSVRFPSTFDGTTVTFTCSDTYAGTYDPVYNADGTVYSVPCAAGRFMPVDYTKFIAANYLKVVAGSAQAGTDTVLTLYLRTLA